MGLKARPTWKLVTDYGGSPRLEVELTSDLVAYVKAYPPAGARTCTSFDARVALKGAFSLPWFGSVSGRRSATAALDKAHADAQVTVESLLTALKRLPALSPELVVKLERAARRYWKPIRQRRRKYLQPKLLKSVKGSGRRGKKDAYRKPKLLKSVKPRRR